VLGLVLGCSSPHLFLAVVNNVNEWDVETEHPDDPAQSNAHEDGIPEEREVHKVPEGGHEESCLGAEGGANGGLPRRHW